MLESGKAAVNQDAEELQEPLGLASCIQLPVGFTGFL
jgi:hypothetical protein